MAEKRQDAKHIQELVNQGLKSTQDIKDIILFLNNNNIDISAFHLYVILKKIEIIESCNIQLANIFI